jgi:uncharacterized protein Yka (UPF0111/DUF47 family)
MVRLIPRDEKFYDLFIKDGENLLEAARKLESMVNSYDRLDERVAEIQVLEKQGDQIDDELLARLQKSFITPFDREDIHELVVHLDDVVDGIQATAETFIIYGIAQPDEDVKQLVGLLSGQAVQLLEALTKLERKRMSRRISRSSTTWSTRRTGCRARPSGGCSGTARTRSR